MAASRLRHNAKVVTIDGERPQERALLRDGVQDAFRTTARLDEPMRTRRNDFWACRAGAPLLAAALLCVGASAQEHEPQRQCFSTAQTREKIEALKLADPFASMRAAREQTKGEPLSARLCRNGSAFVYEISVVRPDGRIVRILFDATTGKAQGDHKED